MIKHYVLYIHYFFPPCICTYIFMDNFIAFELSWFESAWKTARNSRRKEKLRDVVTRIRFTVELAAAKVLKCWNSLRIFSFEAKERERERDSILEKEFNFKTLNELLNSCARRDRNLRIFVTEKKSRLAKVKECAIQRQRKIGISFLGFNLLLAILQTYFSLWFVTLDQ